MMMDTAKQAQPLILLVLGMILGAGSMYLIGSTKGVSIDNGTTTRLGGYELINPLLSCDVSEDTPSSKFMGLKLTLQQEVAKLEKSGQVQRVAVYFRDMDYGDWTGVNENDLFAPASLMKVPLMVAYLNEVRTEPNILSIRYALDATTDENAAEYFKPVHALALGNTYSVDELMHAMIEQSDNNATQVLLTHVPTATFLDAFDAFGVPPPTDQNADSISPKEYMRFFRIIYNSTYLGRIRSITALDMLSKVDFPSGLASGVPKNIVIANKFGERTVFNADGSIEKRELSDCGIVYYPHSPYGICVMVEGDDFDALSRAISQVSEIAYKAVDAGLIRRN